MNNFADIDVSTPSCRGCGQEIVLSRVRTGEDDTTPWRVTVPPGHSVLSVQKLVVQFRCRNGDNYAVETPEIVSGDPVRELEWWISQLKSKKKDLLSGPDCGRMPPTPDEIKYFEDKIRKLGGDPDRVDHETWVEYHDRLVKEYYDFDAEWALIKEICPELDKPAPEPRPVRRAKFHPYQGVAVGFLVTAGLNFMIGATTVAVVWFALATAFLVMADRRVRR